MAGLNIPGVTDRYNTKDTVEKLMQVERIPLVREQKQLETLKHEKDAWREINTHLSSLRDKTKSLYSFENPFNNKITNSTEEYAITADANRGASLQSFKIDVIQPASADRFLSKEIDENYKVPQGTYIYKVGEKQINLNWKGGSLKDFSQAINKRSNGIVKSMIVGASAGKKTLLIESLLTGKDNKLIFEGDAKKFAYSSGMIKDVKNEISDFGKNQKEFTEISSKSLSSEDGLPNLSLSKVKISENGVKVSPRGAFELKIPEKVLNNKNSHISFTISASDTEDITEELNKVPSHPELPDSGYAEFEGIRVNNMPSETQLNIPNLNKTPVSSVESKNVVYAILKDGTEQVIESDKILSQGQNKFDIAINAFKDLKAIAIKNENTGKYFTVSDFSSYDPSKNLGYAPVNPVSIADDAIIKYEGITITRSSNTIDDVVPEITLNVHEKTERTATISVKADVEASKDALFQFVGEYNQTMAKINILTQNKPELIDELSYLSKEEKESEKENLGIFQAELSLTNIKSAMQTIITSRYNTSDEATYTLLSQIGIGTNGGGFNGSYSQSSLRGYLEIDEKKLDSALENHLDDVKALFGYDTDSDLIIDSGIACKLDKQIGAYTQIGGILANKTSSLDTKIKSSESKITRLEAQMDRKEAELRNKYSQMEGALNSLESQQNSISNFTRQQNRSN